MGRGGSDQRAGAAASRRGDSAISLQRAVSGDEPIIRLLTIDPQFNQVYHLAGQVDSGDLDVDPPYQRGSVWGEERKRNLIRSLTMGLPVGSIFINHRDIMEPDVVVDGKQRLLAVRSWLNDELSVPAHWFGEDLLDDKNDDGSCVYSQLSTPAKRFWRQSAGVQVNRTKLQGEDAEQSERHLFDLINFGGVEQGDSDPEA